MYGIGRRHPLRGLITGGAGFIGSHLAEELLERGWRVCILDDLSTGDRQNVQGLLGREDVRFVEGTVLDRKVVQRLVNESDVVFHLAAAVGVRYIIDHPLRSLQVNVQGTETVLEACLRAGRQVLLASTSEVYGKNGNGSFHEEDDLVLGNTTTRRWGYACSKAMDEFFAMAYHRDKGLPVIIVRFFNTCGPRQTGRYGMVIPRFVRQALLGEPITVHGDGKQTRSFTDVSDAVGAVLDLIEHAGAVGQVFNIGNPEGITIEALAEKVKAMTGSPSPITYVPYDEAFADGFEDMRHRVPDISKIQSLIGFQPRVTLDELLRRVIEYTAAQLDAAQVADNCRQR
jgi:UDP-glucose 4-epimerase